MRIFRLFTSIQQALRVWWPLPSLVAVMSRQGLQTWTTNPLFDFEISTFSHTMIELFYQFDAKIFYLIHLLHSSTCFEHYYAHLSTASGIVTLFGWLLSTQVTRGLSPLHVSSTIVLIFRRTIVLIQPLLSSLSLGDCSVHRLREDSVLYMFRALLCLSSGGQLY